MEKLIENDFNEKWVEVTDKSFIEKIKSAFEVSTTKDNRVFPFAIAQVMEDSYGNEIVKPYWVIDSHMGKNGCGEWLDYFTDIRNLFVELGKYFEEVYLIKWNCDVADDVSYPLIGVSGKKF